MQQEKKTVIRELLRMIEKHQEFEKRVEEIQKESCGKADPLSSMLLESSKFMSTSIALLAGLVLNEVRREPDVAMETEPSSDRDWDEAHDWMDALEISATPAKVCRRCGVPKK